MEIVVDSFAYLAFFGEIHRCSCNRRYFPGRNLCFIGREPAGAIKLEMLGETCAAALAVEVEIGVVGKIDHGRGIGCGPIGDFKVIVVIPFIFDRCPEVAGITGIAVVAFQDELYVAIIGYDAVPDSVLEPVRAAVKVVWPVVYG
jgi:hypothetical protein